MLKNEWISAQPPAQMGSNLFNHYTNAVRDLGVMTVKLEVSEGEKKKLEQKLDVAHAKIQSLEKELADARMAVPDSPSSVFGVPDRCPTISRSRRKKRSSSGSSTINVPIVGTRVFAWRKMIQHWNHGDPERGLMVPLKDINPELVADDERTTYSNRKRIGEMYNKLGEEEFIAKFNPDEITMSKLICLISKFDPLRKKKKEITAEGDTAKVATIARKRTRKNLK